MADDAERAVKATRAKAMLQKRRQKAAAGTPTASSTPLSATPPPHERTQATPTLSTPQLKDVSSLFGDTDADAGVDFGEFGVLSSQVPTSPQKRVLSPPPVVTSLPPPQAPAAPVGPSPLGLVELRALVTNQQQTISLLVDEKASLANQLDESEELQQRHADLSTQLDKMQSLNNALTERLKATEQGRENLSVRLSQVEQKERTATEGAREKDISLEESRQTIAVLRARLEKFERELRTLQEDDRAEMLERSLKSAQERASELEMQLGKAKQNLTNIAHERDSLSQQLQELTIRNRTLSEQHITLQADLSHLHAEHRSVSSQLTSMSSHCTTLESQLLPAENTITALQSRVSDLSASLASTTRQLTTTQTALSDSFTRLAAEETAHVELQRENSGLLAQLQEMRPKVVELLNKSAEDEEAISRRDMRVRELEGIVSELELLGEEQRRDLEGREGKVLELEAEVERLGKHADAEFHGLKASLGDVRAAYEEVLGQMGEMRARAEKAERNVAKLETEVERWAGEAERWEENVVELKGALEATREAEAEALAMVERIQVEADSQGEHQAHSPMRTHHHRQPSLKDELISNLRQQHALDLSTSHSRIRELETAVFDAQAQAHALQRRIALLEDDLSRAQRINRSSKTVASFLRDQDASSSRRHSLTSTRPHTPSSLRHQLIQRPVYEDNLSVETRHKRKVSLGMLKARIESERAAAAMGAYSLAGSLSQLAVDEVGSSSGGSSSLVVGGVRRSHIGGTLDESHVFWCHSCRGDLVVL